MQTVPIELDQHKARALYREYKKHLHWSTPIDRECQRAYQFLAMGRLVIQALESVKAAGVKIEGEDFGLPKLALCRADALSCAAAINQDGSATMAADDARPRRNRRDWSPINSRSILTWPAGTFPVLAQPAPVAGAIARADAAPASAPEARPGQLSHPLGGGVGQDAA